MLNAQDTHAFCLSACFNNDMADDGVAAGNPVPFESRTLWRLLADDFDDFHRTQGHTRHLFISSNIFLREQYRWPSMLNSLFLTICDCGLQITSCRALRILALRARLNRPSSTILLNEISSRDATRSCSASATFEMQSVAANYRRTSTALVARAVKSFKPIYCV